MKKWLREQNWYMQNHNLIVFLVSGVVAYIGISLGTALNAPWFIFGGGMILMLGLQKAYKHFINKDN